MSLYDRVADLDLVIDDHRYERLEQATRRFTRVSTVVVLAGRGEEGRGEDVIYEPGAHDALPVADLRGTHTIRSLSARLDAMDLFPGVDEVPPLWQAMADYRRWAFESAALDLALRQEGCSLGTLLGLEYRPVRFCVSAGDPEQWLQHDPTMEFKLDATPDWSREYMERLQATGSVACVDLKSYYEGTVVDNPPDATLYRNVVECFPDAVIEDAKPTDETRAILEPAAGRLSWDAPIHSLPDVLGLPFEARVLNIKPSRFGSLERLLETIEHCQREGVALYGGGQFELGPGRYQIQALASLFYPDGGNDVAPGVFNTTPPGPGLPTSPLPVPERPHGFAFGDR
jgi:L-alanine-DL-glutamate epimerase-like enolase superfamily enzyme